jgi:hypothetical protein
MSGYNDGFSACSGGSSDQEDSSNRESNDGSNEESSQAQSSERDWSRICNRISFALISPCSELVNSDNTLTPQGIHVRNCIENGALLAGGAILLNTPPSTAFHCCLLLQNLEDART